MPEHPQTAIPEELVKQLHQLLADRLSVEEQVREEHGRDISRFPTAPPDVVVFPENNEEIQQIVRACAEFSVPIIPFGTGTAVEGGVLAIRGGVSIDLGKMNRVLRFSRDDADVTVEACISRSIPVQMPRSVVWLPRGLLAAPPFGTGRCART